mmetsp:Transcript_2720/g.10980  ORF Transcript_2720/g.10980 Transcript_2720/m.10980 type:complete len:263 (+) Transcript_2720:1256-2044(+)
MAATAAGPKSADERARRTATSKRRAARSAASLSAVLRSQRQWTQPSVVTTSSTPLQPQRMSVTAWVRGAWRAPAATPAPAPPPAPMSAAAVCACISGSGMVSTASWLRMSSTLTACRSPDDVTTTSRPRAQLTPRFWPAREKNGPRDWGVTGAMPPSPAMTNTPFSATQLQPAAAPSSERRTRGPPADGVARNGRGAPLPSPPPASPPASASPPSSSTAAAAAGLRSKFRLRSSCVTVGIRRSDWGRESPVKKDQQLCSVTT